MLKQGITRQSGIIIKMAVGRGMAIPARNYLTSSCHPNTRLPPASRSRKTLPSCFIRSESSSAAASNKPNPYKPFARPFAKVFLGALFTYQVIYWAWEKLRLDEVRKQKLSEVKELEMKLDELQKRKDGAVGRPVR